MSGGNLSQGKSRSLHGFLWRQRAHPAPVLLWLLKLVSMIESKLASCKFDRLLSGSALDASSVDEDVVEIRLRPVCYFICLLFILNWANNFHSFLLNLAQLSWCLSSFTLFFRMKLWWQSSWPQSKDRSLGFPWNCTRIISQLQIIMFLIVPEVESWWFWLSHRFRSQHYLFNR